LSLVEYRDLVAGYDRPTEDQCMDFVEHVAGAHSWYKHLPPVPPGVPFLFFLDPNAGRAETWDPSGRVSFVDREEGFDRFHYSWMTTAKYRERFGCLHYTARAGTQVGVGSSDGLVVTRSPGAIIWSESGNPFMLPAEIVEAGSVGLTAMLHEDGAHWWFGSQITDKLRERLTWPIESGGEATLQRILEASSCPAPDMHEIVDLVQPELERQRSLMLAAVARVLDTVYS
jgi:hypothetical protein